MSDNSEELMDLRARILKDYDVDIQGVYCLYTGKQIGTFSSDELTEALWEEDSEAADYEELADSLIVRVVASMRPSPAMNKPDESTIRDLALRDPVRVAAYLLNRLYGNRQLLTARGDDSFTPLVNRIHTYRKLEGVSTEHLTPIIHWLLELDSKLNLHDVSPPSFNRTRLAAWIETRVDGVQLIDAMLEDFAGVLPCFEKWVFVQLDAYDKRDAMLTRQANWARGNTMTKSAYVRSWLDNPQIANRKRAEQLDKEKRAAAAKPSRPKSEKTRILDAKVDSFMGMLEAMLDGKVESKPVPMPETPKPKLRFAGQLFKAKKD